MDTNFEAFQPKIFQLVFKGGKKKKKKDPEIGC